MSASFWLNPCEASHTQNTGFPLKLYSIRYFMAHLGCFASARPCQAPPDIPNTVTLSLEAAHLSNGSLTKTWNHRHACIAGGPVPRLGVIHPV